MSPCSVARFAASAARRVRRSLCSPLVFFLPLGLVTIVVVGATVRRVDEGLVSGREHDRAVHDAQLYADYAVAPLFDGVDPNGFLDQPTIDRFRAGLAGGRPATPASVTLLRGDGRVLWADDASTIGRHHLPPVPTGISGHRILDATGLFETTVPVRRGNQVVATMALVTPYAPIAGRIGHDVAEVTALVVGGMVLLYAVLVPAMVRTQRRLSRHASTQEHLALHDPLTGLANRALLREEAMRSLAVARRRQTHMALFLVDLDKFKEVNDTLGHHAGDVLLRQVAARLHSVVRDSDLLARLGGDEFAILAEDIVRIDDVKALAQRVLHALLEPFTIEDFELDVGASIGAAVFPGDGEDVDTLMNHADAAMYRAKTIRNAYALYHPSQDGQEPERLSLVATLRRALDTNQIVLHYQPLIDVASGRIVAVEALARWDHPERGLLAPSEFLDAIEVSGLMPIFTDHVLDRSFGQCRAWMDSGLVVPVAVNLSARSLEDPHLHDKITAALAKWGLPPSVLELEFSEAVLMYDADRANVVLSGLAELGIRLGLDDFGTGSSSLPRLRQLPLSHIKIDGSLLTSVADDDARRAVVCTAINLAHDLGLEAVAEGVESPETWHLLRALDCDLAQGFFFSRPQPAPVLEPLLRQHCAPAPVAAR